MREEFTGMAGGRTFLFKRIEVEDLPLTYHIHFDHNDGKHIIFRMRMEGTVWKVLHQALPRFVFNLEKELEALIKANEEATLPF